MDNLIKAIDFYIRDNDADEPLTLRRLRYILVKAAQLEDERERIRLKAENDAMDALRDF